MTVCDVRARPNSRTSASLTVRWANTDLCCRRRHARNKNRRVVPRDGTAERMNGRGVRVSVGRGRGHSSARSGRRLVCSVRAAKDPSRRVSPRARVSSPKATRVSFLREGDLRSEILIYVPIRRIKVDYHSALNEFWRNPRNRWPSYLLCLCD